MKKLFLISLLFFYSSFFIFSYDGMPHFNAPTLSHSVSKDSKEYKKLEEEKQDSKTLLNHLETWKSKDGDYIQILKVKIITFISTPPTVLK